MSIFFEYGEPKDLLAKLVREGRRAYLGSKTHEEVCDHFFNYCITAHSLRDWCISHLGLDDCSKSAFHDRCNKSEYLKYCRDIANTSKHFALSSDRKSTVDSIEKTSTEIISVTLDGQQVDGSASMTESVTVMLPDGKEKMMFQVLTGAAREWNKIFDEYGIAKDNRANTALIAAQWIG